METSKIEISVVSPVYQAGELLHDLVASIEKTMQEIGLSYEVILVDDRSQDDSWEKIERIAAINKKIKGIQFSKNYGQHVAISAGLEKSCGDYVVVLDCDLQHNPEDISKLYKKAIEGYEIVLARHANRQHSWERNIGAWFFRLIKGFCSFDKTPDEKFGTFSLISRKVVQSINQIKDVHRHYLQLIYNIGFSKTHVEVTHQKRKSGRSNYNFYKLLNHLIDGIMINPRPFLIRILIIGCLVFFISAIGVVYVSVRWFLSGLLPGWSSLIIIILGSTGINLLILGVLGLYIGAILDQVKDRPLYVIDKTIN